jgi:hypothetical protein
MPQRGGADHVSTYRRHYIGKDRVAKDPETHLIGRSYRQVGKVKNETAANLSHLPGDGRIGYLQVLAGRKSPRTLCGGTRCRINDGLSRPGERKCLKAVPTAREN